MNFKTRVSCTCCCISGCKNSYTNTDATIKFYNFPAKPHEQERRLRWIEAVRLQRADGMSWAPKKGSRICSEHFVGGFKSNDPRHPAYTPTIFPEIYEKITKEGETFTSDGKSYFVTSSVFVDEKAANWALGTLKKGSCSIDPLSTAPEGEPPTKRTFKARGKRKMLDETPQKVDACVGTGPMKVTRDDIEAHANLKMLAGIPLSFFNEILTLFKTEMTNQIKSYRILDPQDRLLLFLMHLKYGMSLLKLGSIFGIHAGLALTVFHEVLNAFTNITKDWIEWPPKEKIFSDSRNQQDQRVIVLDVVEIFCETPHDDEHKIKLFSLGKKIHTFKFLVGVAWDGSVCFLTDTFNGSVSDYKLLELSGFSNLLEPGDIVIGGKESFAPYKSDVSRRGAVLVTPPFRDLEDMAKVAKFRVRFERTVQKIHTFQILNFLKISYFPNVSQIIHTCCVLANHQVPRKIS